MFRFVVADEEAGLRVDVALAGLAAMPRSQVQRWIEQGRVTLNAAPTRASQRVTLGDELCAEPGEAAAPLARAEAIELCVLFEDPDLIVVDKAAGMVVHPAPGHPGGTLVNALLHRCSDLSGVGGVLRPGIVHRLDRGTSGVLVAAKNDTAHGGLQAQFQDHSIERVYLAVVRGVPGTDAGVIDRPIGRHRRDRKRMSVNTAAGREARTEWRVRERFARAALLEVRPQTGRTHQIRVHLASLGIPIAGDPVYGRARRGDLPIERPALHAAVLGFRHPRSGEPMRFESEPPEDFLGLLAALRG